MPTSRRRMATTAATPRVGLIEALDDRRLLGLKLWPTQRRACHPGSGCRLDTSLLSQALAVREIRFTGCLERVRLHEQGGKGVAHLVPRDGRGRAFPRWRRELRVVEAMRDSDPFREALDVEIARRRRATVA